MTRTDEDDGRRAAENAVVDVVMQQEIRITMSGMCEGEERLAHVHIRSDRSLILLPWNAASKSSVATTMPEDEVVVVVVVVVVVAGGASRTTVSSTDRWEALVVCSLLSRDGSSSSVLMSSDRRDQSYHAAASPSVTQVTSSKHTIHGLIAMTSAVDSQDPRVTGVGFESRSQQQHDRLFWQRVRSHTSD